MSNSYRFEIDEDSRQVTFVIVPIDVRMNFPFDAFIEFGNSVADVRWRVVAILERSKSSNNNPVKH